MNRINNPRSISEYGEGVFIKTSRSINLENEASELFRCEQNAIHSENILTPKFISYDKPDNILKIGKVTGQDLFPRIWNTTSLLGRLKQNNFALDKILENIGELGIWLSKYHHSTNFPDKNVQAANWLSHSFISKLRKTYNHGLMSSKKIKSIENRFLGEIDELKNPAFLKKNNLRICQIHGDLIIYNILINSDLKFCIIDFADTRRACNLDDIARFYSNFWAISKTNNLRNSIFPNIVNQFIQKYGYDLNIVNLPYFKSLMAYNFITHLNSHLNISQHTSIVTRFELKKITNVGLRWIDQEI